MTIATPITIAVNIAGVESKCKNVYSIIPARQSKIWCQHSILTHLTKCFRLDLIICVFIRLYYLKMHFFMPTSWYSIVKFFVRFCSHILKAQTLPHFKSTYKVAQYGLCCREFWAAMMLWIQCEGWSRQKIFHRISLCNKTWVLACKSN